MNQPQRRFRPLGTFVLAGALLATVAGLVVVALGPWRVGVAVIGGAMVVSSFARTLLPERHSGLLRVRRATADVFALTVLGITMVTLAFLVPDQPGL
ncbi:MAG: DUF3017 domain-containing protein [Actinomycetota bacterium]|nr:DUF3017 domain-containing protein [Actinomycetota bacterium]